MIKEFDDIEVEVIDEFEIILTGKDFETDCEQKIILTYEQLIDIVGFVKRNI